MNARYTFLYLFVIYFSFILVISANIRRYVNYFDIQVLMIVAETETLTSTLHHNIFTYLDYVFSATFILLDFIHIYFHIYIYIYNTTVSLTYWVYIYIYICIYIYIVRVYVQVWVISVSSSNGIPTFVDNLMSNPSIKKE